MERKVFIAAPFTVAMDQNGIFEDAIKTRIDIIHQMVKTTGKKLFSAHERENWGENLDVPSSLARIDIHELKQCSHLIVYWGHKISVGVGIEIGLAIAFQKPILLIHENISIKSDFYSGLVELGYVEEIKWVNDKQVEDSIATFLK